IDADIGQHGVGAAGFAINPHAGFEIVPAAVAAGWGPALAFPRGVGYPARAAPGAHQDRRPAFAAGPDRQGAAVDRLAAPDPVHDLERVSQGTEAVVVIAAEQFEIRPRRAAADAEAQPAAGQGLYRLHAMCELDRVAQRHLQHPDAEL